MDTDSQTRSGSCRYNSGEGLGRDMALVLEGVAYLSIAFRAWRSRGDLGGGEQKALLFTIRSKMSGFLKITGWQGKGGLGGPGRADRAT